MSVHIFDFTVSSRESTRDAKANNNNTAFWSLIRSTNATKNKDWLLP